MKYTQAIMQTLWIWDPWDYAMKIVTSKHKAKVNQFTSPRKVKAFDETQLHKDM